MLHSSVASWWWVWIWAWLGWAGAFCLLDENQKMGKSPWSKSIFKPYPSTGISNTCRGSNKCNRAKLGAVPFERGNWSESESQGINRKRHQVFEISRVFSSIIMCLSFGRLSCRLDSFSINYAMAQTRHHLSYNYCLSLFSATVVTLITWVLLNFNSKICVCLNNFKLLYQKPNISIFN